jgi:hypothetical protein
VCYKNGHLEKLPTRPPWPACQRGTVASYST